MAWWSGSLSPQLHLTVTAAGLGERVVHSGTHRDQFFITMTSPELGRRGEELSLICWHAPKGMSLQSWFPEAADLLLDLITDIFTTTARQLNLVAPPTLPAAVFGLAASARVAAAGPPPVPNRSELARLWDAPK